MSEADKLNGAPDRSNERPSEVPRPQPNIVNDVDEKNPDLTTAAALEEERRIAAKKALEAEVAEKKNAPTSPEVVEKKEPSLFQKLMQKIKEPKLFEKGMEAFSSIKLAFTNPMDVDWGKLIGTVTEVWAKVSQAIAEMLLPYYEYLDYVGLKDFVDRNSGDLGAVVRALYNRGMRLEQSDEDTVLLKKLKRRYAKILPIVEKRMNRTEDGKKRKTPLRFTFREFCVQVTMRLPMVDEEGNSNPTYTLDQFVDAADKYMREETGLASSSETPKPAPSPTPGPAETEPSEESEQEDEEEVDEEEEGEGEEEDEDEQDAVEDSLAEPVEPEEEQEPEVEEPQEEEHVDEIVLPERRIKKEEWMAGVDIAGHRCQFREPGTVIVDGKLWKLEPNKAYLQKNLDFARKAIATIRETAGDAAAQIASFGFNLDELTIEDIDVAIVDIEWDLGMLEVTANASVDGKELPLSRKTQSKNGDYAIEFLGHLATNTDKPFALKTEDDEVTGRLVYQEEALT